MAGSTLITVAGDLDIGDTATGRGGTLVVDDGGAFGEALVCLLARHRQRPARSHIDELPRGVRRHRPSSVVLVLGVGDQRDAALSWLRRHVPAVRVVVVVDREPPETDEGLLHLTFDARPQDLVAAVTGSRSSEGAARPGERRLQPHGGALGDLTARELDVLQLLLVGRSSSGMAADLGISQHTVRTHMQNIMGKLGVRTRLQAAAVAHRSGLRPPQPEGGSGPGRRRSAVAETRR